MRRTSDSESGGRHLGVSESHRNREICAQAQVLSLSDLEQGPILAQHLGRWFVKQFQQSQKHSRSENRVAVFLVRFGAVYQVLWRRHRLLRVHFIALENIQCDGEFIQKPMGKIPAHDR
jgi:hypothetical protein